MKQRPKRELDRLNQLFQEIGSPEIPPDVGVREARVLMEAEGNAPEVSRKTKPMSEICGKVCYTTQSEADSAIIRLKKNGRGFLRHYFCEKCKCFHLSSGKAIISITRTDQNHRRDKRPQSY